MPKEAKGDAKWMKELKAFAASGKDKMGNNGPKANTDDKYKQLYAKIQSCRRHQMVQDIGSFFQEDRTDTNETDTNECTCGQHVVAKQRKEPPPSHARAPILPPMNDIEYEYDIGCRLPKIPKDIPYSQVKATPIQMITSPGFLDLFVFAPTNGFCPFCKSNDIQGKQNASHLKLVLRLDDFPYYCQRVDMRCNTCQKMITSSDSRYVVTLPFRTRYQMPFFHTGACTGIDNTMIRCMRNGQSAAGVGRMAEGAIEKKYSNLVREYKHTAQEAIDADLSSYGSYKEFPPLEKAWIAASYLIVAAFIRDFSNNREELCREIQSYLASLSLAVDHQKQVVNRVKKMLDELYMGKQSFVICGDLGIIMNYVVVPNTADEWTEKAMDEVYQRHMKDGKYEGPSIVFVDCGCCNGKLQTATTDSSNNNNNDDNTTAPDDAHPKKKKKKLWTKKLDGLHCIMRITRETNAEHPRAKAFCQAIANALYISDPIKEKELEQIRTDHKLNLTDKEKKADTTKFGRKTPGNGEEVAKLFLVIVNAFLIMDKVAENRWKKSQVGRESSRRLNRAHFAYPLISDKVQRTVRNQIIHCRNGCLDLKGNLPHIKTGMAKYRNTNVSLPTYASTFGTSRCETVHSVAARYSVNHFNITTYLFDARMMWKIIHYNRTKCAKNKINVDSQIPPGLTPSDFFKSKVISMKEVKTPLLFGWDYCRTVIEEKNNTIYDTAQQKCKEKETEDLSDRVLRNKYDRPEMIDPDNYVAEEVEDNNDDNGIMNDNEMSTIMREMNNNLQSIDTCDTPGLLHTFEQLSNDVNQNSNDNDNDIDNTPDTPDTTKTTNGSTFNDSGDGYSPLNDDDFLNLNMSTSPRPSPPPPPVRDYESRKTSITSAIIVKPQANTHTNTKKREEYTGVINTASRKRLLQPGLLNNNLWPSRPIRRAATTTTTVGGVHVVGGATTTIRDDHGGRDRDDDRVRGTTTTTTVRGVHVGTTTTTTTARDDRGVWDDVHAATTTTDVLNIPMPPTALESPPKRILFRDVGAGTTTSNTTGKKRKIDSVVPVPVPFAVRANTTTTSTTTTDDNSLAVGAMMLVKDVNPQATWCDDNKTAEYDKNASRSRKIGKKRGIGHNVDFVSPDYSAVIEAAMLEIYYRYANNVGGLDRTHYQKMTTDYANKQHYDALLGNNSTGLLPCSLNQIELWAKKINKIRTSPLRSGRTCSTSIGVNNDLRKIITNQQIQHPPAAISVQQMSILQDTVQLVVPSTGVGKRPKPTRIQRCQQCNAILGVDHKRGHCPFQSAETTQSNLEKSQTRKAKTEKNNKIREQRREQAAVSLQSKNITLNKRTLVPDGHRKCQLCYQVIRIDLSDTDPMWHLKEKNQWTYCPFVDADSVKDEFVLRIANSRIAKATRQNEKRKTAKQEK